MEIHPFRLARHLPSFPAIAPRVVLSQSFRNKLHCLYNNNNIVTAPSFVTQHFPLSNQPRIYASTASRIFLTATTRPSAAGSNLPESIPRAHLDVAAKELPSAESPTGSSRPRHCDILHLPVE